MANGPSREERRKYFNSGKEPYNNNQENVLFPQAQADIYSQVGQRGQALDQWYFQQQQSKDNYGAQVKQQTDTYKNQIQAFEKSDQIYQKNQEYIQGAYDRKVEEADAQYSETVQAGYFNLDAAQRQFGLDRTKSQNEINRYDLNIDKYGLQKGLIDKQITSGQDQYDAKNGYIKAQKGFNQTRFDNTEADIKQQRLRNQTGFENQRGILNKQIANNQASYRSQNGLYNKQIAANKTNNQDRQNYLDKQIGNNQSSYLSQDALYNNQIDANVTNYKNQIAYLDKTIEDVDTRAENDVDQAEYNRNVTEANRLQTVSELTAQKTYLESQATIALEEKNSRDSQIDLSYQEKVASGMYEQLANKVQAIVDQGAVSSRGSRGRSVATNLNNTVAAAGFNGARLAEGLLRSATQRDIQKVESTTGYDKVIAGITQESANNTSRLTREEAKGGAEGEIEAQFTLSKALIEDNATGQKRSIKNNKREEKARKKDTQWSLKNAKKQGRIQRNDRKDSLKFSKKEATAAKKETQWSLKNAKKQGKIQRDERRDSLKFNKSENTLNKKRTNDSLKANLKSAKLDRKTAKSSLNYDQKSSKLTKDANKDALLSNKKQLNKDIQDTNQRQNLIAAELGFTAEQLDMTAEQLGESILSASAANTRTKNNLKRMAKQENLSAFYQRMARPKFTALPKPPYKVDMPKFAPVVKMASPGEFVNASDSGYLDATRPASGPSGISKALQIGGMVLGAVAAPFTMGASVAGSAALMSAGTAAAISGGGALLGGLGQSGLFDRK